MINNVITSLNNKITISFDSDADLTRILEILNIKVGE
jgi:hypothetical protein